MKNFGKGNGRGTNREKQNVQDHEIARILHLTESAVDQKSSEALIDHENEIITLISGRTTSLAEIKRYISETLRPYEVVFPQVFYRNMLRLCGYKVPKGKIRHKPAIFAVYTVDLIYRRFPKHVLETFQVLNPFVVPGIRLNYHHQWLNDEGQALVKKYIAEAVEMMERCEDWYEFRIKYALEHNLSLQLRMNFDNPQSQ